MNLSILECRKILGKIAEEMTDQEIEDLKNYFAAISDLAIDTYLDKRSKTK